MIGFKRMIRKYNHYVWIGEEGIPLFFYIYD